MSKWILASSFSCNLLLNSSSNSYITDNMVHDTPIHNVSSAACDPSLWLHTLITSNFLQNIIFRAHYYTLLSNGNASKTSKCTMLCSITRHRHITSYFKACSEQGHSVFHCFWSLGDLDLEHLIGEQLAVIYCTLETSFLPWSLPFMARRECGFWF